MRAGQACALGTVSRMQFVLATYLEDVKGGKTLRVRKKTEAVKGENKNLRVKNIKGEKTEPFRKGRGTKDPPSLQGGGFCAGRTGGGDSTKDPPSDS